MGESSSSRCEEINAVSDRRDRHMENPQGARASAEVISGVTSKSFNSQFTFN